VKESPAPAWLADFQDRFGRVLRTPLDRASGTLRATPSAYDPLVGAVDGPRASASERLAVYNRQYWFRLFTVMQGCFPLTTRLLGHWTFNGHAGCFLLEHPPRGWDVERVSDGFVTWLAVAVKTPAFDASVEGDAVLNAAEIDAAFRAVFLAPEVAPFRPAAEDAPRILGSRLVSSPAARVIEERWPLLDLRRSLEGDRSESLVPLPERLAQPRWWALVRKPQGIEHVPLDPREGLLLRFLERFPVQHALALLEAECSEPERAELPARARGWLARGVEHGLWIGIQAAP
jgi:hypothetical protein